MFCCCCLFCCFLFVVVFFVIVLFFVVVFSNGVSRVVVGFWAVVVARCPSVVVDVVILCSLSSLLCIDVVSSGVSSGVVVDFWAVVVECCIFDVVGVVVSPILLSIVLDAACILLSIFFLNNVVMSCCPRIPVPLVIVVFFLLSFSGVVVFIVVLGFCCFDVVVLSQVFLTVSSGCILDFLVACLLKFAIFSLMVLNSLEVSDFSGAFCPPPKYFTFLKPSLIFFGAIVFSAFPFSESSSYPRLVAAVRSSQTVGEQLLPSRAVPSWASPRHPGACWR